MIETTSTNENQNGQTQINHLKKLKNLCNKVFLLILNLLINLKICKIQDKL